MLAKINAFVKENFQMIALVAAIAYFGAKELGYLPGRSAENPQPGPVVVVDTEARKLGATYKAALVQATDDALNSAATSSDPSTAGFGFKVRTDFSARLGAAFDPAANELSRRVGPPSESADPSKVAATQAFLREFRAGFRGEK